MVTVAEIGYATASISSISVISSLSALGLDYVLLKRASQEKGKIVGTIIVFEIILNLSLVPIVLTFANPFTDTANPLIPILAVLIFITNGIAFIPKSAMLGIMDVKTVIVYDAFAFSARLVSLVVLALYNFGAIAILVSLLIHSIILSIAFGITAFKKLGCSIGNLAYLKLMLKEGLHNFPTRLSRLLVMNLGVVLFAYLSFDPNKVGMFYMALMIVVVSGEFATSLSTMSLPSSVINGKNIVSYSTKLSLTLSAPLISILLTAPNFILGLLGKSYYSGGSTLFILSLTIIPTALVLNALAKFNSENKLKDAVMMGIIEIGIFLASFLPLSAILSVDGIALAILISYMGSGIFASRSFGKQTMRVVMITCLGVMCGYATGFLTGTFYDNPILKIILAAVTTLMVIIGLKAITYQELKNLCSGVLAKGQL
jgi:O-antigen/teichoic acid export membrane protein